MAETREGADETSSISAADGVAAQGRSSVWDRVDGEFKSSTITKEGRQKEKKKREREVEAFIRIYIYIYM